jgi:DNA-binding response OmpR family regulator
MKNWGVIANIRLGEPSRARPGGEEVTWVGSGVRRAVSILLVEDDEVVFEALADHLRSVFVDVRIARANRGEAPRRAVGASPQVVIVDTALADDTWLDMLRKLRRTFPAAWVVALTAGGALEARDALAAGADACVPLWHVRYRLEPTLRRLLGEASRREKAAVGAR